MSSRQPKLILRENCIEDVIQNWPTGSFLELGAGTGYMTRKFLTLGYHGACYDLGEESRKKLKANLESDASRIRVVDTLSELPPATFDYLLAFEVLEHIQDDAMALHEWTHYLKPGGRILISVPAHARKYGKSDELVGHVRRYERAQMMSLLNSAGYENIELLNYGYPLTELSRFISNLLIAREKKHLDLSLEDRSTQSSFTRPQYIRSILRNLNEEIFIPFRVMQRWFYQKDWGDGLVAVARKPLT
jgi:SAM-dependent methyltransferase